MVKTKLKQKIKDFIENHFINTDRVAVFLEDIPAGINLLKVKNRSTRTRCKICSKLTIKTYFAPCSSVSIANFEHLITGWDWLILGLIDIVDLINFMMKEQTREKLTFHYLL